MHTPTKFWYKVDIKSKILSFIFYPFSLLWIFLDTLKRKFSNPYKSRIKIICVGNLNVGGTGKTPLCICIFKHLKNLGYNPIFLTSGYKGKTLGPAKVKENNNDFYYGDEPLLLSKVGPTIVSKNKYKGIKFIENLSNKFDIIIMDDGLQNYKIKKSLNILTIDRKFQFGNGFCLPAGPLRQTLKTCINLIDCIITTGNKHQKKLNINFKKSIFNSYISFNKKKLSHKKKYIAFSGLANNEKFFDTLKLAKLNIFQRFNFPDHFQYSTKIVKKLIEKASNENCQLITTEKDIVKIEKKYHKFIDILPIEIKIESKDSFKFKSFLQNKLNE